MAIKLRRGLEIDRMPIVFAQGEIIYVIDTKKVYIGDGVTFGGNLVTGEELLTALDDVQISSLANNNLLSYNSTLSKWQNKAVTTADIPEVTNLYFTNERVDDRVAQLLLAGANVTLTYNDSSNTLTIDAAGNVQSVNTQTGAVVLTTTDISEGTNLYYTQARFNSAFTAKSTSDLSEGTNEYFTAARVRAVVLTGISLVTNAVISASDSVLIAFGKLQAQITANLSTLTSHTSDTSNPHATTKAQVGLGNADNTSDANKPVSTATQTALNAKENTITAGTTSEYYRGDKTFQTLDKTAVGLGNVANVDTTVASNIASGILSDSRLSSNVTLQGNTFNGVNQLLKLDGSGKLPAVDGSQLTGLISQIANLSDVQLTSLQTGQGLVYNGTKWTNVMSESTVRHDYTEPYSYVGKAPQFSLEGSNVWEITRIQNLTDANVLITTALNVSWTNRNTHTYS
jgi:hypothetical protein